MKMMKRPFVKSDVMAQTNGYRGAEHKQCKNIKEAEEYIQEGFHNLD